jgi:hypothetical protein
MGQVPTVIRKRTVFILGAGASADFDFPSGYGLLQDVVRDIQTESALYTHLIGCDFSPERLHEFARDLNLSAQLSVDAFLENRTEFMEVGKAAIAGALIPHEDESRLHRADIPNWYRYLFNQLGLTRADHEHTNLSIITFNYDRSFERFLFLALRASFGLSDDECSRVVVQVVPIVHVYGQLGTLEHSPNGRAYRPGLSRDDILKSARQIKILREGLPDDPQFNQAHDWLRNAEVICFLGFGYHPSNIVRLQLNQLLRNCDLYGSVYGMRAAEIQAVRASLERYRRVAIAGGSLILGDGSQNVLEFLRSQPVLQ